MHYAKVFFPFGILILLIQDYI